MHKLRIFKVLKIGEFVGVGFGNKWQLSAASTLIMVKFDNNYHHPVNFSDHENELYLNNFRFQ